MHMLSKIKLFCALLFWGFSIGGAQAFETNAKAAYIYDLTTGTVLLSKNADTPLPPASMSKLMTLYIAFEFIRAGQLSLEEKLPVSAHAQSLWGIYDVFGHNGSRLCGGSTARYHRFIR